MVRRAATGWIEDESARKGYAQPLAAGESMRAAASRPSSATIASVSPNSLLALIDLIVYAAAQPIRRRCLRRSCAGKGQGRGNGGVAGRRSGGSSAVTSSPPKRMRPDVG